MNRSISRWSIADVRPNQALSYWEDALASAEIAVAVTPDDRNPFHYNMSRVPFAHAAWLNDGVMSAQVARRTPHEIRQSAAQYFLLFYLDQGQMELTHAGRTTLVETKQCTLIDTKQPYHIAFGDETRGVSVQIEQDWLRRWVANPEDHLALRFGGDGGWGRPLCGMLANLKPDVLAHLALPETQVLDQLGGLLSLAVGPQPDQTRHQHKLIERLKQALHERCHEPDLNPAELALSFNISKRYLHALFAASGTSFGEALMASRLDLAQTMLRHQNLAGVSITEIALRCGFREPAHLARRFRARTGVSPTAFRKSLHS